MSEDVPRGHQSEPPSSDKAAPVKPCGCRCSSPDGADPQRRSFLTTLVMGAGLAMSYGTFAGYAGRYLYPARPRQTGWMYVAQTAAMRVGDSLLYRTPSGSTVTITRQRDGGVADDFVAMSSVCPHLGCQVHWESQNNRYFCPCHNGVFDPSGKAVSGPPAEAGQSLAQYPLKIEAGLLYIEVELESLA